MPKLQTIIEEEAWDLLDFSNVTVRRAKKSKVTVRTEPWDLLDMSKITTRPPLKEIDLSKVTIRRR
jgi:hypothetical protein